MGMDHPSPFLQSHKCAWWPWTAPGRSLMNDRTPRPSEKREVKEWMWKRTLMCPCGMPQSKPQLWMKTPKLIVRRKTKEVTHKQRKGSLISKSEEGNWDCHIDPSKWSYTLASFRIPITSSIFIKPFSWNFIKIMFCGKKGLSLIEVIFEENLLNLFRVPICFHFSFKISSKNQ